MGFLAAIPAAFGAVAAGTATAAQAAIAVGTVATVAGAGSTAYGAYSDMQQAKFQSQVAKNNAKTSELNRQSELMDGAAQESMARTETGRRIAGALAAQGANGLDVNFGSPAELRGALQNEGDLDAMTIRYNATKRALGFSTQASGFLVESQGYKQAAKSAGIGGAFEVGSTFISGASSLANKVNRQQTQGIY